MRQTGAPPGKVLGVFGLSPETKESDLREEFSRFGRLDTCVLIVDKRTGVSKKFGFIHFAHLEDAKRAKEQLNGKILHGHQVRIDYSYTKKPHSPTPGRYMGKTEPVRRAGSRYEPYYARRSPPRDYYERSRYDDRYDDRYDRERYDDRYGRYEERERDRYRRH